uniref:TMEM131_like domain-containing protein n=1 Tax=Trichuris muris TaxID=70415 RepID=A0A5S6QUF1_TRIMR
MLRGNRSVLVLRILLLALFVCSAAGFDGCYGAFIQTGERLEYFLGDSQLNEGIQFWKEDSSSTFRLNDVEPLERSDVAPWALKIDPPELQFGPSSIGIAKSAKVRVHNPTSHAVRLDAISGSTVHFHCSFFENKILEPGGSTTFEVAFLPRREGSIKNTLFLHSSAETLQYPVGGNGVTNPYRLQPFVGNRISLNGSLSRWIEVYNPFPVPLQVVEMYSSDSSLHLDLPVDCLNNKASFWNIPPFRMKRIANARVVGNRVKNTSAFIRLKTDRRDAEPLLIPVEVEVTAESGIFPMVKIVDFGRVAQSATSRWFDIYVFNTFSEPVWVTDLRSDSASVAAKFKHVELPGNNRKPVLVARIAYRPTSSDGDRAGVQWGTLRFFCGSSVIPCFNITYKAEVLNGQLRYHKEQLTFFSNSKQAYVRSVSLTNTFSEAVAVYRVAIHKRLRHILSVLNSTMPAVLRRNDTSEVFALQFSPPSADLTTELHPIRSMLTLYANVTRIELPVFLFDGKLKFTLLTLSGDCFDFGVIGVEEKRSGFLKITNRNPVSVKLLSVVQGVNCATRAELLFVDFIDRSADPPLLHHHSNSWNETQPFLLPPDSFAFLKFTVIAPSVALLVKGRIVFETEYEVVEFPVTFSVEEGPLVSLPEAVVIGDAFPGKVSTKSMKVFSKFREEVSDVRLSLDTEDVRFSLKSMGGDSPKLKPFQFARLARLTFSPASSCQDQCYVGFSLNSDEGNQWKRGLKLPPDLPELDFNLFNVLWSRWSRILESKAAQVNASVSLETSRLPRVIFPIRTNLVWPRLVKQEVVHFPLTAVGNFSLVHLLIRNPSSHPVAIQIIPLAIYPNTTALMKLFGDSLLSSFGGFVETDDVLMFSLRDSELYNAKVDSPVPRLRRELEEIVGTTIPRFTLSFFLRPAMKLSLRVGFLPSDYQLRSSLLLIRNNLTGLEMLPLYGRGAKLELKIGNVLPQSNHLILFEIQDKHLLDCDMLKRQYRRYPTTLSVSRTLVARNSGEMPLYVTNISINGYPCQNRGFRVANCEPFLLAPNETRPMEILFRPDFTMCWYEAQLQIVIRGYHYPFLYKLGASVPKEGLAKCYSALPRPSWEQLLYYCGVIALGFLMICVIASAYLEGDRSIECALRQAEEQQTTQVFDLNAATRSPSKVDNVLPVSSRASAEAVLVNSTTKEEHWNGSFGLGQLLINVVFKFIRSHCTWKGVPVEKASVSSDEPASEKPAVTPDRRSAAKKAKLVVKAEGVRIEAKIKQPKSDKSKKRLVLVEQEVMGGKAPSVAPAVALPDEAKEKTSQPNVQQPPKARRRKENNRETRPKDARIGRRVQEERNGPVAGCDSSSAISAVKKCRKHRGTVDPTDISISLRKSAGALRRAKDTSYEKQMQDKDNDSSSAPEWNDEVNTSSTFDIDADFCKISQETEMFAAKLKSESSPWNARSVWSLPQGGNSRWVRPVPSSEWNSPASRSNSTSSKGTSSSSRSPYDELNGRAEKSNNFDEFVRGGWPAMPIHGVIGDSAPGFRKPMCSGVEKCRMNGTTVSSDFGTTHVVGRKTLMQELREERQKRVQDHYARQREEWPGLNLVPEMESMWDEECVPWKRTVSSVWDNPSASPAVAENSCNALSLKWSADPAYNVWAPPQETPSLFGQRLQAVPCAENRNVKTAWPQAILGQPSLYEDASILAVGPAVRKESREKPTSIAEWTPMSDDSFDSLTKLLLDNHL